MPSDLGSPILVTVIGGYLGAGKTTLVNHILRVCDERIAVLINDFGSIAIDEDLIVAADEDKITLANGCICCSLVDGFAAALNTVRQADNPPHRLLIEASGVADPEQIAAYGQLPGLTLDGVVTLADAELVRAKAGDDYVGDIVCVQLRAADVIVLNKTDLVGADELARTAEWLRQLAPAAVVVDSQQGSAPIAAVLGPVRLRAPHQDDQVGADELFESWSYEADHPVGRARFDSGLAAVPEAIFRIKGVVRFSDDPDTRVLVHRVGARQTIVTDGAWRGGPSRIVLIGPRGAVPISWSGDLLRAD